MKKISMRMAALLLALLFVLTACTAGTPAGDTDAEPVVTEAPAAEPVNGEISVYTDLLKAADPIDDNNLVFYEIFVGSFSDSNGDGIGDLRGIINRMDYLNDGDPNSGRSLGIEGIWLTPIFESPTYHKYDVTDYYKIDPSFGTEADLIELLELCHSRGVKVILDLVLNHTGNRCAWFKAFTEAHRNGDTNSEYYDFYSWYDASKESAPRGRTFQKISGTNHYYECNFWHEMPELNYDNEAVRQAVLDVANYYIDLGVDGFRFDAAKYVYFESMNSNAEFWKWYMDKLRERKPDIYAVAEVWDTDSITDKFFPAVNCFNFDVHGTEGRIASTAKKGNVNTYVAYVEAYQKRVKAMRESAAFTPFIANHDTDRAAGFLTVASGTMKVAANLYILGPGSPFIYYGEELGMRGTRGSANTDANRRLAMLWGDGDTVKDPEGTTYDPTKQVEYTVQDQIRESWSLYSYYKELLMLRRANPEIAHGSYKALKLSDTKVGGFIATLGDSTVIVLHNTTTSSQTFNLSTLYGADGYEMRGFIGVEEATLEGTVLTLGGQTSVVIACK